MRPKDPRKRGKRWLFSLQCSLAPISNRALPKYLAAVCRIYADCVGDSIGYLAVRSSPGDLMAQLDAKSPGDTNPNPLRPRASRTGAPHGILQSVRSDRVSSQIFRKTAWPSTAAAYDGSTACAVSGCAASLHAPGDKAPPASSARCRARRCSTARMCRVSTQITARPAAASALNSHCDSGPASRPFRLKC